MAQTSLQPLMNGPTMALDISTKEQLHHLRTTSRTTSKSSVAKQSVLDDLMKSRQYSPGQYPTKKEQAEIHPAFRQQTRGGSNDIISPHANISGHTQFHETMSLSDRILELTKSNGLLQHRLACHKAVELSELKLRQQADTLSCDIDCALKKFEQSKANDIHNIKHEENSTFSMFDCDRCSVAAGDITLLDHFIAQKGGTTFTFEQLPHRLEAAKKNNAETMAQRESELVHMNKYLLKELEYHRKIRIIERRFYETIDEMKSQIEEILNAMRSSCDAREIAQAKARSILLDFWGIQSFENNIDSADF